jgi:hypothetical protein
MLNKRDRNKIYRLIEASGLDPAEFSFKDTSNKITIVHGSESRFELTLEEQTIHGLRNFGFDSDIEKRYTCRFNVTDGIIGRYSAEGSPTLIDIWVPTWLREIRETIGAPDLWEELKNRRQLLAEAQHESENTPFTGEEQRQIAAQLQEIKDQLQEQSELTNEQLTEVNKKLDEVAEASKRMGRKDWLVFLLGTITALIITATVTGGLGEHIFSEIVQGLSSLFASGYEPPSPPQILA